ncbi:MAG TPA: D-alanine--D-alanine ligase [Acidobacteria bacterium]|nr:D-alanine--D-alanine ligase [Acidobacteriota bacterium]
MKKLRVLALLHDYLVPPDDVQGVDVVNAAWKTEYDVTNTLATMGHDVYTLGLADELGVIKEAMKEVEPHVAFNLMEAFHEVSTFDQNVVSHLELLRLRYTGCNPRGMILSRDKALAKKVLAYDGIPVPAFTIFPVGRVVQRPKRLRFPLIVKSLSQDASFGISQASVVTDDARLRDRVAYLHEGLGTDAIVEQYVEGRELYIGVIGNERTHAYPVWEMKFADMAGGAHHIATARVKWSTSYQRKHGIHCGKARLLRSGMAEYLQFLAKRVFHLLQMTGYGRIDIRLDNDGQPWVLEANANPQLAYGEDFAESAHHEGVSYEALLQRILNVALQWKADRAG